MSIQLEKDGITATLTIRRNEVESRAHIQFENGVEDLRVYPKDETEDYIIYDLVDYCGYKQL